MNDNMFEKSTFSIQKRFCNRLGVLSGSFWELLGVSWELLRASGSTKEGVQIRLGTLLGLVCLLRAAEGGLGKVLGSSLARFIPSRSLLGSILSSQTDPQKLWFYGGGSSIFEKSPFSIQ